jgi:transketolase
MPRPDVDMRDAFFDSVYELASRDANLVFLTADHGAFSLERFRKDLPRQYFNVGIAEQNMVSVAAGLALSGKSVFIYSIVNFITLRCFEQLSVDLGTMKLPVTIVGVGAGFTYSTDGPTHHGIQDVAAMATIPNLRIFSCSDAHNSVAFAKIAYEGPTPAYVRVEKGIFPDLYDHNTNFVDGLAVLRPGKDVIFVTSGYLVHAAIDAARQLAGEGIDAGVIDLYRIKPLNTALLVASVAETKAVITIEDNVANGGIGSMVATALLEKGVYPKIRRLTLGDKSCHKYGSREWVYAMNGLDVAAIKRASVKMLTGTDSDLNS